MSDCLEIELPYPPTVNSYWRTNYKAGKTYISKKSKEFQSKVFIACMGYLLIKGKVRVEVDLYPPDRRKRDIDNPMKALLDALTKAKIIEDDSFIDQLKITRKEIVKQGKTVVRIFQLEGNE